MPMSDLSRYLPLSQRRHEDESGVTSDWRAPFAATLRSLADTLQPLPQAGWDAATARDGVSVRDTVADAVTALTASARERAAGRLLRRAPERVTRTPDELVADLRTIADADRKRRIAELSEAVLAAADVARALDAAGLPHRIAVDPLAMGAVALARSLSAPLPVRAVLRGLALAASDGGWQVGHGAVRTAAASDIVLFLFGRSGVPDESPADYDDGE
jgi:hypothetical protein